MLDITIGNLILAPRPRYIVEEISYEPKLSDSAQSGNGAGCVTSDGNCPGVIKNWEITLRVRCLGRGDIKFARIAYKIVEEFANSLCGTRVERFARRYCDEQVLEHYVNGGYFKQVDFDWLPDCCDSTVLSGELHLFTVEIDNTASGMIYDYNILQVPS